MNFFAISALINLLTSLILGFFVLASNRRNKVNLTFFLFTLSIAFWSFGYYFWQISDQESMALFWTRFLMAGAVFIPFTYLSFVYAFLGMLKRRKGFLIFTLFLFLLFFSLNFTDLFVNRVEPILDFDFWPMAGPVYSIFLLTWFFYVAYTTLLLYKRYKDSNGIDRAQAAYVLGGMMVGFIGGSTNYFLWYKIPVLPYGNILVAFYVLAIGYAIIKHHLMDVKVIATEVFSAFLVVLSFIQIFQTSALHIGFRVSIFLVTFVFAVLLIRSVLNEVKRRQEMESLTKQLQKASKELKSANKELQRLDEAKSEFLSIASHQLRTPSTVIKGYISMMVDGNFGKISTIVKDNLQKVYTANERLLNLIENLLDISRIEAGRVEFDMTPVDLTEVARSIVEQFEKPAKDKKLTLTFAPEKNIPQAMADVGRVKEVMSNIIDNAIKYTEQGEVVVGLHQESQSVVFACQDNGMGIEPDDLPRLFNKFVRGKGMMKVHTEGTGLGLYYARKVIEEMGGRIWAESPGKGRGSKFCFSLPLANKEQAKRVVK